MDTDYASYRYVGVQPWDYPFTFDISGSRTHTVTQVSNVWTNASGPSHGVRNPPSYLDVPDQIVPNVSPNVVRDGYDLLRRLGRLDLARHYPELGVTDTCGPRPQ